jgi:hypothetical protein
MRFRMLVEVEVDDNGLSRWRRGFPEFHTWRLEDYLLHLADASWKEAGLTENSSVLLHVSTLGPGTFRPLKHGF